MRFRGSIPREWAIVSGFPGSRLQHPGAECLEVRGRAAATRCEDTLRNLAIGELN